MKVITIDMDIIMAPVIESYNDKVGLEYSVTDLLNDFPYMKTMQGDLFLFEYIIQFYLKVLKTISKNKIHFISSHEEICSLILNEKVDLINIDHHHDIGYDDEDWDNIVTTPKVGNWVKYLYDNNQLLHYYWIGDNNSIFPDERCPVELFNEYNNFTDIKSTNLNRLLDGADMIVFCESAEWVPMHYQPLFHILETMHSELDKS